MRILITGAGGLIGHSLSQHLNRQGHHVEHLSRTQPEAAFYWSDNSDNKWTIQWDESQPIDAVIHLAGENLGQYRWSQAKKQRIYNSRIYTTRALVAKMKTLKNPPKAFLSASAIGYYGEGGDKNLDESQTNGDDFLANLALDWETAANAASEQGIRVVNLRTGLVLSKKGGALAAMLPAFKRCVGGKLGNGNQYMSWVSLADITQMITFLLTNEAANGAYNLVSPYPVRNSEFTQALAETLNRPAKLNMPALMVKTLFGEMGELLLLSSLKVEPAKLAALDYPFSPKNLRQTLEQLLN